MTTEQFFLLFSQSVQTIQYILCIDLGRRIGDPRISKDDESTVMSEHHQSIGVFPINNQVLAHRGNTSYVIKNIYYVLYVIDSKTIYYHEEIY